MLLHQRGSAQVGLRRRVAREAVARSLRSGRCSRLVSHAKRQGDGEMDLVERAVSWLFPKALSDP